MTASSMSTKRPVTCGRIASSTNAPTSAAQSPRRNETVKWLVQNQTSRSRNGDGVVSALPSCAAASWRNTARPRDCAGGGRFSRSSRSAANPAAVVGGFASRKGSGPLSCALAQAPGIGGERLAATAAQAETHERMGDGVVHVGSLHAMLVSHSDKGLKGRRAK